MLVLQKDYVLPIGNVPYTITIHEVGICQWAPESRPKYTDRHDRHVVSLFILDSGVRFEDTFHTCTEVLCSLL